MNQKPVAIVVPCYKRNLTVSEGIAYERIWEIYGELPIIMMAPPELEVAEYLRKRPTLRIERFDFRTIREYSQLLLQREFYERFVNYEYILIYQLDCYIFNDELMQWCKSGFDYIGAPLFDDFEPPVPEGKLRCVGNGGFSLRKVSSAINVLRSKRRYHTPLEYWKETSPTKGVVRSLIWALEGLTKLTRWRNDVRWVTLCNFHEDVFWSLDAVRFLPSFRIPDLRTGLRFAFDYAPEYCYEQNGRRLPFGCHAWPRYDLKFWQRFIAEARDLPAA